MSSLKKIKFCHHLFTLKLFFKLIWISFFYKRRYFEECR